MLLLLLRRRPLYTKVVVVDSIKIDNNMRACECVCFFRAQTNKIQILLEYMGIWLPTPCLPFVIEGV